MARDFPVLSIPVIVTNNDFFNYLYIYTFYIPKNLVNVTLHSSK